MLININIKNIFNINVEKNVYIYIYYTIIHIYNFHL